MYDFPAAKFDEVGVVWIEIKQLLNTEWPSVDLMGTFYLITTAKLFLINVEIVGLTIGV